MDVKALAYPDTASIAGTIFKASRDPAKRTITIPCDDAPSIYEGLIIDYVTGGTASSLRVVDFAFQPLGQLSAAVGSGHLLTIQYERANAPIPALAPTSTTIHIGSVTGQQVQIGDQNSMAVTMHVHELVEKVAQSGDTEAKGKLLALLENKFVATALGAGAAALVRALTS